MPSVIQIKSAPPAEPKAEMKAFAAFEIKDAEKGEVEAIVATLGVVDRDEDIIREGAIPEGAKVVVSAWGHDAVYGERPIGKGALHIVGSKVVFKGRIFLSTIEGRETFAVLKEMGSDQEWSFGFRVLGWEIPNERDKKNGARRVLTKLGAFEVSPVLIGAGIGTRTTAVKQADGDTGEPPAPEPGAAVPPADAPPAEVSPADPAPEPAAPPVEAPSEAPSAEEAAKAAQVKALAMEEVERFQRTLRRLGVA